MGKMFGKASKSAQEKSGSSGALFRLSGDPELLEWAQEAALAWLSARRRGQPSSFVFEDGRFGDWLDWLTIERPALPGGREESLPSGGAAIGFGTSLRQLYAEGALGEVVLSALIQCRWPARRERLDCLSRSELLVYFDPEQVIESQHVFSLDDLWRLNHERLQELPPRQILEASLPYWPRLGGPESFEEDQAQALEAWIMLHCEQLTSLLEVPPLLRWSWEKPASSSGLELPLEWWHSPEQLSAECQERALEALVGPGCLVDLASTVQVLGPEYCRNRLSGR
jgi:hypothetical protein